MYDFPWPPWFLCALRALCGESSFRLKKEFTAEDAEDREVRRVFLFIPQMNHKFLKAIAMVSLLCAVNFFAAYAEEGPLSLKDCYRLALKQSEVIALHKEFIKETEARFIQVLSGLLPRATFSSSDRIQDGAGSSAFTLRHVPERKFVFTQPLFSGFKEFAAMIGSRHQKKQKELEKTRAEQLLFLDVVDAFYLLLEQREDMKTLAAIRAALKDRIRELKKREKLGRSRESEVASARAQLRRVEAEVELVKSQEIIARQLLEFLTGRAPLEEIIDDAHTGFEPLGNAEEFWAKSEARPDVIAMEEAWRVAEKEVTIERAKLWPVVGLESNYYTKRVGVARDVDWDVLFKVDVPLFQGGQVVGASMEVSSRARQAKLNFERAKRSARLEIRDAYVQYQAALARSKALEKAHRAADESYHLQEEDYRLSLVNNLDVLSALQALQDARRDFFHAHYEAKRLYWRLKVAVGETIKG